MSYKELVFDILDDLVDDLSFGDYIRFLDINELTWELAYDKNRLERYYHQFAGNISVINYACLLGDLEMIKWLIGKGDDIRIGSSDYACRGGHLDIIKWIWHSDPGATNTWDFETACEYGHLELAKWIYGNMRLGSDSAEALELACYNGHLEVAKWLMKSGLKFYIPSATTIVTNGHLKVLKWVHKRWGWIGADAMSEACRHGHLDIVKWLHEKLEIPITWKDAMRVYPANVELSEYVERNYKRLILSGVVPINNKPDIIINPCSIPSRMTMGQMFDMIKN